MTCRHTWAHVCLWVSLFLVRIWHVAISVRKRGKAKTQRGLGISNKGDDFPPKTEFLTPSTISQSKIKPLTCDMSTYLSSCLPVGEFISCNYHCVHISLKIKSPALKIKVFFGSWSLTLMLGLPQCLMLIQYCILPSDVKQRVHSYYLFRTTSVLIV